MIFEPSLVRYSIGIIFSAMVAFPVAAKGDTLDAALVAAFRDNPTLEAARAGQRATKELLPQAKSGWKPTITVEGSITQQWSDTDVSDPSSITPKSLSIQLSQPLFRGFKTVEGIKKAKADIATGQFNLDATEQAVLFDVVTAYVDVWRDQNILKLRKQNVAYLAEQVQATSARFKAGELTRTDVEQSKASLAQSKAAEANARSDLQASLATFEKLVGHKAKALTLPTIPKMPGSLDHALSDALQVHPTVLAAQSKARAAGHSIEIAKGDLLPQISLSAVAQATDDPSEGVEHSTTAQLQLTGEIALYDGGLTHSSIRQAKQTASKSQIEIISAVRDVRKSLTEAWGNFEASRQSVISTKAEVNASLLALSGVQQEYEVGSRNTSDVLDAQQSLLNAQISQVNAARNLIYTSYGVIYAMGSLSIEASATAKADLPAP